MTKLWLSLVNCRQPAPMAPGDRGWSCIASVTSTRWRVLARRGPGGDVKTHTFSVVIQAKTLSLRNFHLKCIASGERI